MIYRLLLFLLKLLSYIPYRVLYFLSDGLYYLLYYVVGYRRKIVRRNLVESFPEKGLPEIKQIEKKFYRFFMDMILESCKLASISPEEIRRRMKFTNVEQVNALQNKAFGFRRFFLQTVGHFLAQDCSWSCARKASVLRKEMKACVR